MFNGDYQSMAEAVGEAPDRGYSFVPGEDFDPADEGDVQAVLLASQRDDHDRSRREIARLQAENASLRGLLDERQESLP